MDLHLAQVCFFKLILDGMHLAGSNVDRLLKNSGLNKFNLGEPDNHVPVQSMYAFLNEIEKLEGIHDLSAQFIRQ